MDAARLRGAGNGTRMQVAAIGATGFVGSHAVRLLIERGHRVTVVHRGSTTSSSLRWVPSIHCDRNDLSELGSALTQIGPDVVLDVISYTERHARDLTQILPKGVGRIVTVSSADVYRNFEGFRGTPTAPPDPVPLSEDAPLRETRFPYRGSGLSFDWIDDYDKILVEDVVRTAPNVAATVLRLPAVYGPGDERHRFGSWLRRMYDGRPAVLLGKRQADWCWTRGYVENVAAAVALTVTDERSAGRTYNVGERTALTEREWVDRVAQTAGWTGDVVVVPDAELPEHLRSSVDYRYHLATDTRRIREELHFAEPVGAREALRRTVEWERSALDAVNPSDYAAEDATLATFR